MREVRIHFSKTGLSRYISHLDLMRTMTRAIRRASLPLWYTEGFNPHPYLAFALPLSLGMESDDECMDIRIEGDMTNEEVFSRLCAAMPDGISILNVTDPVMNPKVIAFGRFEVKFETDDPEVLKKVIDDLLARDELIVQKLGKKGHRKILKDINLIDYIREFDIKTGESELTLTVLLPAGSKENVNPDLIAKRIQTETNCPYELKRIALYNENSEIFR